MKSAKNKGAAIVNYAKIISLIYDRKKIIGVKAEDTVHGHSYEIYAKKIVCMDSLQIEDLPSYNKLYLQRKEVCLMIKSNRLPIQHAVHMELPSTKVIYAIPIANKIAIGMIDLIYQSFTEDIKVSQEDQDYLLNFINQAFPNSKLTEVDIVEGWTEITPVLPVVSSRYNKFYSNAGIFIAEDGMITVKNREYILFRKKAEKVVNIIAEQLLDECGRVYPPCSTAYENISGGILSNGDNLEESKENLIRKGKQLGIKNNLILDLLSCYGTSLATIYEYVTSENGNHQRSNILERLLRAEIMYAINEELVIHATDFLNRRTSLYMGVNQKIECNLKMVLKVMGECLAWNSEEIERQRVAALEHAKYNKKSEGIRQYSHSYLA